MTFTPIVHGTLCPLTNPLEDTQGKKTFSKQLLQLVTQEV